MRIVDITGWIHNGMWQYCDSYPGARITECEKPPFIPADKECYCQNFEIGGQSGTYIETAAHVDATATPVVDIPLDELFMDVAIIKVPPKGPLEKVTLSDLEAAEPDIRKGDGVIIATGWDRKWRDEDFVEASPYMSRQAADWLFDKEIKLLGSDLPRFDNINAKEFPWERLWRDAKFLLAPVANLDSVRRKRAKLCAFPIKVEGAMGTPCRAAIFEDYDDQD